MSTPSAPPTGTGTGTGTGTASSAASTVPKPPPTSSAPSSSSGQPPPSSSTSDTAAASNSNGNKQVQVQVQVQEEEKKMDDTEDNNNNNDDDGKEDSNSSNNSSSNIPVTAVAMKLLDIKLKPSSAIIKSIIGEFTSDAIKLKIQQIIIARSGGVLELYNISSSSSSTGGSGSGSGNASATTTTTTTTPSLKLIKRLETRSILRDITTIRLVGEKRDVLACSSDSGCLSIIDFNIISTSGGQGGGGGSDNNNIESAIVTTPYGKSGCRRSTPGQYLACDPKGRAICVSAIEKRKLVYVLNHNQEGGGSAKSNKIALASPLEAHRTRTLCLATVGVDNGYDNPMFACIEIQYSELDDGGSEDNGDGNSNNNNNNKQLAYYELDLGLNHVSRKWAISIPYSSYSLEALPGYSDGGPSGVLVGSENEITWYHNSSLKAEAGVKCTLPKRVWDTSPTKNINTLVTQLVIHRQKRNKFFGLCQTEIGDTFKIDFDLTKAGEGGGSGDDSAMDITSNSNDPCVKSITIALLDTLPLANSLNISKKGLLFLASEFGGYYDHGLYQFERIDLPNSPTMKTSIASSITSSSSSGGSEETSTATATATATAIVTTYTPSSKLQNLILIDKLDNLSPTIDVLVGELTGGQETAPQIYTIGGKGPSACLKTLRHGCSVTELAISELPGIPGQIFTVNNIPEEISGGTAEEDSNNNNYSKYIVVSFADATLVLSVGDTVEEVGRESGFLTTTPTLACGSLRNGSCIQIHPIGVRHILKGQAMEWHVPGLNKIECASTNTSQVVIALAGGEIIYFELDLISNKLTEGPKRRMKADVCCLDVGIVSSRKGEQRSLFCAVGCRDSTIQIISLEPSKDKLLKSLGTLGLKSRPNSVKLLPSSEVGGDLILMVGLDDGSSLRATVDPITGSIGTSPTRRFLGARPVSVSRIPIEGKMSLLLLSSRPWISRSSSESGSGSGNASKHIMAPLSYTPLDHGCSFSSEAVPEGVVATSGNTLRIISIDSSSLSNDSDGNEAFNTNKVSLRYTPRQMTLLSTTTDATDATTAEGSADAAKQRKVVLAVVESDYNDYGLEEKTSMGFDPTGRKVKSKKAGDEGDVKKEKDDDAMDEDSDDEEKVKKEDGDDDEDEEEEEDDEDDILARSTPVRGPIPPLSTPSWGSCVRLVDPSNSCDTLDIIEMGRNEAALCCCSVRFHTRGGESLLAVGSVSNLTFHPLKQSSSHIALYRVVNGERLQLLHKTTIESNADDNVGGPILALAHFQGRLLVGIGRTLRLYEMGKRQLLRKCELKGLPTFIKTLQTAGDRAYFGDMMRSLHIVRYEPTANRLVLIANDPCPRPIVCQELLDFNTIAVGDKFGNISVLRLPRGTDTATVDLTGERALWDTSTKTKNGNIGNSNTAKLETLCQYYIGEVVTSMTRSSLVAGVAESLIYVTVTGRIGALVPFNSRDDVEFYSQLEELLRVEAPRITGRDPQSYRSYYSPVMHVIDGDLCDSYINGGLSQQKQTKIAERLDRSVGEIMKKLEDTRNSLL